MLQGEERCISRCSKHILKLISSYQVCLFPVEELACAPLLHDLGPGEAGEVAEPVRAVDDGIGRGNLGIAQDKVAVCR